MFIRTSVCATAAMVALLSGVPAFCHRSEPDKAQSDSLVLSSASVVPGGTVALNLSLTSPAAGEPAGLQWTLTYSPSDISSITASAGAAATAAGKFLLCSGTAGSYTCLLTGLNTNVIQNGAVAVVTVTVSANVTQTSIGITNALGTSPAGDTIPIAATGGSITTAAPVTLTSLTCYPSVLNSQASSACTVGLSGTAPARGVAVTLSDGNAALTIPASVTVPAGNSTANFIASTGTVTVSQTVVVTASLNGVSKSFSISLVAPAVSSLACNPAALPSGGSSTCTITLNQTAPSGGAKVSLSSNNAVLTVPASAIVAAGSSSATFTATAGAIADGGQSATLTATLNGASQQVTLLVASNIAINSLGCAPSTLASGASAACVVKLNRKTVIGVTVHLTDPQALLTIPASVAVLAGQTSATFTATAGTFATSQTATVTATLNGTSQTATLNLVASQRVSSLVCYPIILNAGASGTCTVTLSAVAPTGGVATSVSANSSAVTVPSSVTVPASSSTSTFPITAASATPSGEAAVAVTAALNGTFQSASLTVMCPCSVWPSTAQPLDPASPSGQAIEVGMKFSAAVSGYVTGVRFYKGSTNTGTHVGNLWSSAGKLLATVTFANETPSGWQVAYFPSPVELAANTVYVISYHAPQGHTAVDNGFFTNRGVNNSPLQALAEGQYGSNGVYAYGSGGFPSSGSPATNYWVDVVFNIGPTVGTAAPVSLWAPTTVPTKPAAPTSQPAELGLRFNSNIAGYVTGVRFYKSPKNTGSHTGYLWTAAGTLLGSVTFTNEWASGWQQANFAAPIPINANATYVISYWSPAGYYADDAGYFATSGVTNDMLYAPMDGQYGPNSVYGTSNGFPATANRSSNCWVDVVFTTAIR